MDTQTAPRGRGRPPKPETDTYPARLGTRVSKATMARLEPLLAVRDEAEVLRDAIALLVGRDEKTS